MFPQDRVLVSHKPAAWLPEDGRADVVLAGVPAVVPEPVCLARLLVTRADRVLVQPRSDGTGLDIPTSAIHCSDWEKSVETLAREAVVQQRQTRLLGYVLNDVPGEPLDYPWPIPHAYFAVWHCRLPAEHNAPGTWLDSGEAEAELGDRHWWPLFAHAAPTAL